MHTLTAKVIKSKQCGIEVYRLLVFKDGKLYLLKTHMSEPAARYQWEDLKRQARTC
jgi:hypothetical protein